MSPENTQLAAPLKSRPTATANVPADFEIDAANWSTSLGLSNEPFQSSGGMTSRKPTTEAYRLASTAADGLAQSGSPSADPATITNGFPRYDVLSTNPPPTAL